MSSLRVLHEIKQVIIERTVMLLSQNIKQCLGNLISEQGAEKHI